MTQINFTLNQEEILEFFTKDREDALRIIVEKILNQIMLAESNEQLGACRHERTEVRTDYRNGTRERQLTTRIGTITLEVPRHRNQPFHTLIFDNYSRSEASLIATMVELVVNGVSTRRISKCVETLCGKGYSKSTVSQLCKSLDEVVNSFRDRDLEGAFFPYLITDATYFKVRENHRIVSKAMMIALGIREDGKKEIVGFCVKDNESVETWTSFMRSLKQRGLQDPYMITSDANKGQLSAIGEIFPAVAWQRCQSHFTRNIMEDIPKQYKKGFVDELREMLTAKNLEAARQMRDRIIEEYQDVAEKAMETLDLGFDDAMTVMALPEKLRKSLRTSNLLERRNGELKRRSNVVKIFPNEASLNRLMGAVLVEMHDEMVMRRAGANGINDYGTIPSESKINLIAIAKTQQLKQAA